MSTSTPVSSFTWLRLLLNLCMALIALFFVLLLAFPIGFYGMAMYIGPSLPSLDELKQAKLAMPLQIYTQDNKLIGQYGNTMSLPVAYEQIPKNMVNAFLAAEDSSFFQHSGISVKGIGRALTEAVSDDEGQTGGSTITQQVAKNYFLSSERTLNRKLTELFLARKIEEKLSKNDIFTLYVNKIYLGEGAYGIRAAAKQYYSKSLDKLTIAEMAMIAGLPKAPSKYNPVANPERALERRNWIIGQMLKNGAITQAQHDEAVVAPIGLHLYQAKLDMNFPYLAEMTRFAMVQQYGESVVDSGWRIRLTINSETQKIAENALKRGLFAYDRRHGWRGGMGNTKDKEKPVKLANFPVLNGFYPVEVTKVYAGNGFDAVMQDGTAIKVPWSAMRWATLRYRNPNSAYISNNIVNPHDIVYVSSNEDKTSWNLVQIPAVEGSLVSVNPDTGALLTAVGGFDFYKSKFNRALQGYRQPGSTIKPLVYTTALEKGFSPDTLVSDGPLKVGSWEPKNSGGGNLGMIPLRKGLYLSRNLVSIRVLRSAGISDTREMLNQFGLEKDRMPTTLSLALGSGEATPIQMATAYATFANGGHRIQPYFIEQIFDYSNKLIYQANPQQACAICFNSELKRTNEANIKAYQHTQKLLANPDLRLNDKQDTEQPVDLLDENPLDNKDKEKNKDKTKDSKQDKATELTEDQQIQAELEALKASKQQALQAKIYDAGPETDKLKPTPIQYVTAQQAPRIIASSSAFQMANILRDVIQRGTATKAKAMGRSDVGGKTGTTNDAKDAWFAGIHPTMATAVWIGFDQPIGLGKKEFGGVAALPVWMDFTSKMLKGKPVEWVSVNNRAKSKKKEQETIELTDKGSRRVDSKGNEIKEDDKPPQAVAQKRPVEVASTVNATFDNTAQLQNNRPLTNPANNSTSK
ncbi:MULTISPECIES: penicillin-binding protein 1A [unclassified Moraxella]|uniref:penicillin-binding protein 1A n=1 Tax=unclassified Moraxella TaxID=2685852 RepID=UPI003AF52168